MLPAVSTLLRLAGERLKSRTRRLVGVQPGSIDWTPAGLSYTDAGPPLTGATVAVSDCGAAVMRRRFGTNR
jgi:hypothetical protein